MKFLKVLSIIIFSLSLSIPGCGGGGGDSSSSDSGSSSGGGGSSKPDLVDGGSYLEELNPNPVSGGEIFQSLCRIGNNNNVDAGSFYVDLYASVNQTFEIASDYFIARQIVNSLPGGQSNNTLILEPPDFITFPSSIPSGNYYILYDIDSTDTINESNENNNVGLCTNGTLQVQGSGGCPWNPGDYDYCLDCGPCTNGEGDCDGDSECATGTTCVNNIGANYGWNTDVDVCETSGSSGSVSLIINDGYRPHLSSTGNEIVFVRLAGSTENSQADIWKVNIDGSGLTRLTNTPSDSEFSPQWTPDGQRISYLKKSGTIIQNNPAKLWDMATDGTGATLRDQYTDMKDFTHFTRNGSSTEIVVITSGGEVWLSHQWPNTIAYSTRHNGPVNNIRASANPSLTGDDPDVVMNDSTARKIIVFAPAYLGESQIQPSYDFPKPFISPSGTSIVAGTDGGLPSGLYTMGIDGSNMVSITNGNDHQPTWHGITIVFVRVPSGGTLRKGDIYKITGISE